MKGLTFTFTNKVKVMFESGNFSFALRVSKTDLKSEGSDFYLEKQGKCDARKR